ncbi:TIGR03086 family metal-binding protein [Streptomyces sp. RFCAC02]|uniref:TIGR03086 family metal-binding protein n=1 Tax=Streptomyces sp. RFCAC02 TaxID=2499143 RepID=UPI001F103D07|nr:TIGR03086 family metal-binding protein [Streptomyces sp. RFCAC02]
MDLKPACARMGRVVAGLGDGQLDDPTPCAEYDVGELLAHVAEVARGARAVARKEEQPAGALWAPPREGWREGLAGELRALGEAWNEPTAWEGVSSGAGAELPNELWGRIAFTEIVVHGWDLARATGQPFELPDETVRACYEHVAEFVPNAPVPGLWGARIEIPGDAALFDRLLAITGRQPGWTP